MDPTLISEAASALDVTTLNPLRQGAQKYVAAGDRRGESVVLKVVGLETPHVDYVLERARREVALLEQVHHPNVASIVSELVELGAPPKGVAWLEDYLEGDDLRDRLHVPWVWDDAAKLALQVGRGLAALHEAGYIHRDLSPNNIRCLHDGSYAILDPGLARHLGRSTVTGLFDPGTPGFLSPEHVSPGVRANFASDIFSVGILMYRALTGDLPIPLGGSPDDYKNRLRTGQAPSVSIARPDLLAEQASIVDRCLQRQSGRRFLSGTQLVEALESV